MSVASGRDGNAAVSVSSLLAEATARLATAGVESPRLDARLLLAHALRIAPQSLVLEGQKIPRVEQQEVFAALVARRAQREPVSRIVGQRGFWTLNLCLNAKTFDPRPDTETVVETVLAWVTNHQLPCRFLDLGTGSGGLLLALLSELPNATGVGIDILPDAIAAARANARAAGLAARARFQVGDWGVGLKERFDVIVANPPYVAESDFDALAPEVARFDPHCTMAGGSDGLAAYRALALYLPRLLLLEGLAALEIGQGQALAVKEIMKEVGLIFLECRTDLAGVVRCVLFQRMG